jgi:hypothetical protein
VIPDPGILLRLQNQNQKGLDIAMNNSQKPCGQENTWIGGEGWITRNIAHVARGTAGWTTWVVQPGMAMQRLPKSSRLQEKLPSLQLSNG